MSNDDSFLLEWQVTVRALSQVKWFKKNNMLGQTPGHTDSALKHRGAGRNTGPTGSGSSLSNA